MPGVNTEPCVTPNGVDPEPPGLNIRWMACIACWNMPPPVLGLVTAGDGAVDRGGADTWGMGAAGSTVAGGVTMGAGALTAGPVIVGGLSDMPDIGGA